VSSYLCCICVPESTVAFVERAGRFKFIARPGCHRITPCAEVSAGSLSLRLIQWDFVYETRTADNVFITIKIAVQVKINDSEGAITGAPPLQKMSSDRKQRAHGDGAGAADPESPRAPLGGAHNTLYDAFYGLDRPWAQVSAVCEQYLRENIARHTMDELFRSQGADFTGALRARLTEQFAGYGYTFPAVIMRDIDPPAAVKTQMNQIVTNTKWKTAKTLEAEGIAAAAVIKATSDARVRELDGEGVARARRAIVAGLKDSVRDFQDAVPGADPDSVLRTIQMNQYFDVLRHAADNPHATIVMPATPAQVATIEDHLRVGLMTAPRAAQS